MRCRIYIVFVLLLGCIESGFAQDDFFVGISNSRSRAVALGGAVTALEDDIGAISYNPATFSLTENPAGMRFSVHLNPVLPAVTFRQKELFDLNDKDNFESIIGGIKYLFKAFTLSTRIFNFGILLNEEKFLQKGGEKFFDGTEFLDNRYHTAVLNVKLSSQVSFGVSGSLIRDADASGVNTGSEVRYGILVKPSGWYQIGIMFVDFANKVKNSRRRFDRLADESLNAGLVFFPRKGFSLSFDVRNLTENGSAENFGLQEIHFGFEITRISHISLRGGYYREKRENNKFSNVFSAGFGLFDLNRFRSPNSRYNHPVPLISYSILFEKHNTNWIRWHFVTIGFRI